MIRHLPLILLTGVVLVFLAAPTRAQGILYLHEPGARIDIVPPSPETTPPPRPVAILPAQTTSLELQVEIAGQTARTRVDQTFRNPNNRRLEGTYLFPLPSGAAVRDLSLYIDGKPIKCEVLEASKARQIYEDIVRRMRDPALLEYVGRDLVRLRIFPIEPRQTRRVRFEYSQILRRDFGLTEYAFPLAGADKGGPIGSMILSGRIDADAAIASVYSPTHDIEFVRPDDRTVRFSFEAENHRPSENLKIYWTTSTKEVGAGLLTYRREVGEPGYFLLLLSPGQISRDTKSIPKNVTFVFDTSGSMSGEKIEQARRALEFCLNTLRPEDRFNVIRFSTDTEAFRERLAPVNEKNRASAKEFVQNFTATGGTAIHGALMKALDAQPDPDRPHLVIFLTDGQPTIGERDPERIVADAAKANANRARLFCFGVGNEVNTILLDRLSEKNGGVSEYVTPNEDIEVKVSHFFQKVSDPVLTDLALDFDGLKTRQVYPRDLPDLFAGCQLSLIGRYEGTGRKTLVLKGKAADKERTYRYEVNFPEESESADFLPRLWAIRHVGYLVDEIRKNGEEPELVQEVTRLGKQYAIATPYTSLLVVEDETQRIADVPSVNLWSAPRAGAPASDRLSYGGGHLYARDSEKAGLENAGPSAVAMAQETRRMKEVDRLQPAAAEVKRVGDRQFRLVDDIWIDTLYPGEDTKTKEITYGSAAYFNLLKKVPEIGPYLALGPKVIFQHDGKWYRVVG